MALFLVRVRRVGVLLVMRGRTNAMQVRNPMSVMSRISVRLSLKLLCPVAVVWQAVVVVEVVVWHMMAMGSSPIHFVAVVAGRVLFAIRVGDLNSWLPRGFRYLVVVVLVVLPMRHVHREWRGLVVAPMRRRILHLLMRLELRERLLHVRKMCIQISIRDNAIGHVLAMGIFIRFADAWPGRT